MRTGLVVALALLALVVAARGLERRTTWYLASDQFAFLTFADDLRHGTVFHDAVIVRRLYPGVPPRVAIDALFQTYIYRDGLLYSRYPPGFPMLLAATGALAGEYGEHLLNPVLYLVLLAALGIGVGQLAGAGAGVAVMWAMLVVPVEVHYWGITVARDLPAHLLALTAVWLAWRGRTTVAALALGFAATIRPDAVLWGVAVGAVARGISATTIVRGALAFFVGLAPLLAYNTITQGHPLAFTQGSEFRNLLATPRPVVVDLVSGGAFRLSHLRETLPVHLVYLWNAFGLLLVPALGALAWAAWRRSPVAGAFGPYAIVAFVFYSCWGHGDGRYLVGVVLCLLALTAIGVAGACRWIADAGMKRGVAAVVAIALVVLVASRRESGARVQPLELALAGAAAVSLVAPASLAAVVPAAAFAAMGVYRMATGSGARDPFQAPQVERARATIEALVPAGSLVLTTPGLGRPGENISHYTHADAAYLGETESMRSTPARAARTVLGTGDNVFLLLRTIDPLPFGGDIRVVARREGATLYDWFSDPARAPLGAVLYEVKSVAPDA